MKVLILVGGFDTKLGEETRMIPKSDRSIFSRVPFRIGYKCAYFYDKYQAMLKHGYVRFISNLLEHPKIRVVLGIDMMDKIHSSESKAFLTEGVDETVIYTSALDELFEYCFGRLSYRSLRFEGNYKDTESLEDMPVLTDASKATYEQCRALAGIYPNLFCCGRLADFKYYNMNQAIENALTRTCEIDNG